MKILVVEDDPGVQALLQTLLRRDHQVFVASGVPDAKKRIEEEGPFDVIFLDNNLSPGNGAEVVEFLSGSEVKIISLAGTPEPPLWQHDFHLGKGWENASVYDALAAVAPSPP